MQAAEIPRTAPANWPMTSGFSGLPKFMLSVIASGVAPVAVMLRHASATACMPPRYGSAAQYRGVQSVVSASARACPSTRTIGGIRRTRPLGTVCPPIVLSYWSHTQAREHRSGQPISVISASITPTGLATGPSGGTQHGVSSVGR